jgi:hypothetical protein
MRLHLNCDSKQQLWKQQTDGRQSPSQGARQGYLAQSKGAQVEVLHARGKKMNRCIWLSTLFDASMLVSIFEKAVASQDVSVESLPWTTGACLWSEQPIK